MSSVDGGVRRIVEARVEAALKRRRASGSDVSEGSGGREKCSNFLMRHRDLLTSLREEPPLHGVKARSQGLSCLSLGGYVWDRPDPRVLVRMHAPSSSSSSWMNSAAVSRSRQTQKSVVFMYVEDVLLFYRPTSDAPAHLTTLSEEKCDAMIRWLHSLQRKGVDLVFLDNLPALHHSSAECVDERMRHVGSFFEELHNKTGKTLGFTVLFSIISRAASSVSLSSFLTPNAGLPQFYTAVVAPCSLNPTSSIMIGPGASESPFLHHLCRRTAEHMGLRFSSLDSALEGVGASADVA